MNSLGSEKGFPRRITAAHNLASRRVVLHGFRLGSTSSSRPWTSTTSRFHCARFRHGVDPFWTMSNTKNSPMGLLQPLATSSPGRVCSRSWRRWAMRLGLQVFHATPRPLRASDPRPAALQAHCPRKSLKISPFAHGPDTLEKNFPGRREVFRGTPTII